MPDDDDKTRKLDEEYFKRLAEKAKSVPTDSDRTQILGNAAEQNTTSEQTLAQDDNKTRIFRESASPTDDESPMNESENPMDDPPTGWLVAIEGPGKGHVMTLGMGMNGIGRGDVRVPVPFNDEFISRGKSAVIAYDSINRKFYLLPGDGKTLAYLNSQPVIERHELETGDSFTLGKTVFRFVALCNESFDW